MNEKPVARPWAAWQRRAFTRLAAIYVGLGSASPASAEECRDVNCRTEQRNCRQQAYPCGQNQDGTAMMCIREICQQVRVCDAICTQPNPDELSEGTPGLPDFPDFLPGGPGDPVPFDREAFARAVD